MPHISRMQQDIQMHSPSSIHKKDPEQIGKLLTYSYKCAIVLKCLLQMLYPYGQH